MAKAGRASDDIGRMVCEEVWIPVCTGMTKSCRGTRQYSTRPSGALSTINSQSSIINPSGLRPPAYGLRFLWKVEIGVFAEEFAGLLVVGVGGCDFGIEEAEVVVLTLAFDGGTPLAGRDVPGDAFVL